MLKHLETTLTLAVKFESMYSLLKEKIEQYTGQVVDENCWEKFQDLLFEKTFEKKQLLAEGEKICKYNYFILFDIRPQFFTQRRY